MTRTWGAGGTPSVFRRENRAPDTDMGGLHSSSSAFTYYRCSSNGGEAEGPSARTPALYVCKRSHVLGRSTVTTLVPSTLVKVS